LSLFSVIFNSLPIKDHITPAIMNILASADLHLGRQSSGMPETLDERSAVFTWHRLVKLAIEKEVDAVVLAGDVVDRENRFFEAIGHLQRGFEQLENAGISLVMVAGNHDFDVLPDIIKNREYEHIHLLGKNGSWELKEISTRSGQVQFMGWSFPEQHYHGDPLLEIPGLDLKPDPNLPLIGVLHGDLYDAKSTYAPIDQGGLTRLPADAWIIGHIHKPDVLNEANPLIFYPGSPQALSSKERGAHGVVLLNVKGVDIKQKNIPLSPVRYRALKVELMGAEDKSKLRNRILSAVRDDMQQIESELSNVSRLIYDLSLTGAHRALPELERWIASFDLAELELATDPVASIRKMENLAEPVVENLQELATHPTPTGLIAKTIVELESGGSSEFLNRLVNEQLEQIRMVNDTGTYFPLVDEEMNAGDSEEQAKTMLLKECRKLLGELMNQKAQLEEG